MSVWQISCKEEAGGHMDLLEFSSLRRAMLWLIRNLKRYRIVIIVRIEE